MSEKLLMWIAWKMPRKLAMWCAVRVFSFATTGKYSGDLVTEVTCLDALNRWDK